MPSSTAQFQAQDLQAAARRAIKAIEESLPAILNESLHTEHALLVAARDGLKNQLISITDTQPIDPLPLVNPDVEDDRR